MREESVDVDSSVSLECSVLVGRQARDVIPASCPMSKASNVIENCCVLEGAEYNWAVQLPKMLTSLPQSSHSTHAFSVRFVARLLHHHRFHQAMLRKRLTGHRSMSPTHYLRVLVG